MLKVIEVTPYWPAEVFIQRHIDSFSGMDINLKIIAKKIDHSFLSSSIPQSDLQVDEFPLFGNKNGIEKAFLLKSLLQDWKWLKNKNGWEQKVILQFFKRKNPDLIHFHWADLAIRFSWIPLELNIPFSLSMRGADISIEPNSSSTYVENLNKVINVATGIHSVSDSIWHEAADICGIDQSIYLHKTIYTVLPPLSFNFYQKEASHKKVFVTTGRLHWKKNYLGALTAIKALHDRGLDAHLVIVGDGKEKESLIFWIRYLGLQSFITITGTLTFSEILELFKKADAYLQSSISEGFSNSLAEAMANGLPVFATDVGGTREIITDGVNGFLLDPIHPETWWEKLVLIQDRQKMQVIREQAWKDASNRFSQSEHATQFKRFYEQCIELHKNKLREN